MEKTEMNKAKKVFGGGWKRPITDDIGNKWCNCSTPNLIRNTMPFDKGHAYCLRCKNYYYR